MAKRENLLPFSPIGALITQHTGKRVAKEARETATKLIEELTGEIVKKAILLAEHSGRKTIKAKDVNLAFQQIKGDF